MVAQPQDVVAIERTGGYRGRYHVLHGVLSPLDGIGPDDLRVTELVARCAAIDAPAGSPSGRPSWRPAPASRGRPRPSTWPSCSARSGVRATRIATGVPIGGELEYADQVTLARAIDGRREM